MRLATMVLVCTAANSLAAEAREQISEHDKLVCSVAESLASAVMTGRQYGRPMSEVINKITETSPKSESFIMDLAIEAYDQPAYGTESFKKNAIIEFASKYYSMCLQEVRKPKH